MSHMFEVNQQASVADLGMRLSEAICRLEKGDIDSVRDILLDTHGSIYPKASHVATPEENAGICSDEPGPDVPVNRAVLGAVIEELADAAGLVRIVARQLKVVYEDAHRDEFPVCDRPAMTVYQLSTLTNLIDGRLVELQEDLERLAQAG